MANLMKCSRCKSEIDISYFGMNRTKEPYKTCDNCRNTNKKNATIVDVQIPANTAPTFLESYMQLPIIKLQEKQNEDIRLEAIVIINHQIDFEPKLKRYDGNCFLTSNLLNLIQWNTHQVKTQNLIICLMKWLHLFL